MNLNTIHSNIDKIEAILKRWEEAETISDIERELVLDKLKFIYEEVIFCERECTAVDLPIETFDEQPEIPTTQQKVTVEPVVAAQTAQEPMISAPEPTTAELTSESVVFEEETPAEEEEEIVVFEDKEEEEEEEEEEVEEVELSEMKEFNRTAEAEEPASVQEAAPIISNQQQLFDDKVLIRKKVDKQVILSLYGDNHSATAPKSTPDTFSTEPQAQPARPTQPDQNTTQQTIADNAPTRKVFGEMLSNTGIPLNDRIGQQQNFQDVSSKMQSRQIVGGLRQHIGINDKFSLIRDLFGGNATKYEETINTLEEFTDFDEVMIYIQEHYTWNPDSNGTRLLIDLLQRKLS